MLEEGREEAVCKSFTAALESCCIPLQPYCLGSVAYSECYVQPEVLESNGGLALHVHLACNIVMMAPSR